MPHYYLCRQTTGLVKDFWAFYLTIDAGLALWYDFALIVVA
jgi:hypothetical protein